MYRRKDEDLRRRPEIVRKIERRESPGIPIKSKEDRTLCHAFLSALDKPVQLFLADLFANGGYVAGGAARFALNTIAIRKKQFNPEMFSLYQQVGGDIDIFFRTDEAYRKVTDELYSRRGNIDVTNRIEYDDDIIETSQSLAGFATNVMLNCKRPAKGQGYSRTTRYKIQLIGCDTGEPDEVISHFDFRNCMVAFDDKRVWVAEGWKTNEAARMLDVTVWKSQFLMWRMLKYIRKYGYDKLSPQAHAMLINGVSELIEAIPANIEKAEEGKYMITRREMGGYLLAMLKTYGRHVTTDEALLLSAFVRTCGVQFDDMYYFKRERARQLARKPSRGAVERGPLTPDDNARDG